MYGCTRKSPTRIKTVNSILFWMPHASVCLHSLGTPNPPTHRDSILPLVDTEESRTAKRARTTAESPVSWTVTLARYAPLFALRYPPPVLGLAFLAAFTLLLHLP